MWPMLSMKKLTRSCCLVKPRWGSIPSNALNICVKSRKKTEAIPGLQFAKHLKAHTDKQQLAIAAVQLAEGLQAKGIVVITRRGITADLVANCRPFSTNIYAFTNMSQSRRTMTLNRGVFPFRINFSSDPEKTLQTAFRILKNREHVQMGEKVVIISDVLAQQRVDGSSNSNDSRDIPIVTRQSNYGGTHFHSLSGKNT